MAEVTRQTVGEGGEWFDEREVPRYHAMVAWMLLGGREPTGVDYAQVMRPSFDREVAVWVDGDRAGVSWPGELVYHADPPVELTHVEFGRGEVEGWCPPAGMGEALEEGVGDLGGIVMDGMGLELRWKGEGVWDDPWVKIADGAIRRGVDRAALWAAGASGRPRAASALGRARCYMDGGDHELHVEWMDVGGREVAVPMGSAVDYNATAPGRPEVTGAAVQAGAAIGSRAPNALDLRGIRIREVANIKSWEGALHRAGVLVVEGNQDDKVRGRFGEGHEFVRDVDEAFGDEGGGDGT